MNDPFDDNTKITPISSLGEFGLISHLTKNLKSKNTKTIKATGDDAAVIDMGDKYQLFSTDMLVDGVHFDLAYTPLKHLGYKAVVVNVSDICAMNGEPKQIVFGFGLSNKVSIEALDELYVGINLACKKYNLDFVGGDTSSSNSGLIITGSILGEVKKKIITYRNNAKINDLVVVTGDLGGAYLGLQLLKREKKIFLKNSNIQPDLSGYDYALERQLKPEAGTKYVKLLKKLNIIPTSMIDISDGLSSEALHLSKSSQVGITLYEEKIPIDPTIINLSSELNINPITCALSGGEDYELLFTVNQKHYKKLKKDPNFSIIGHIADKSEGCNFIANSGEVHPLTAQGWNSL